MIFGCGVREAEGEVIGPGDFRLRASSLFWWSNFCTAQSLRLFGQAHAMH